MIKFKGSDGYLQLEDYLGRNQSLKEKIHTLVQPEFLAEMRTLYSIPKGKKPSREGRPSASGHFRGEGEPPLQRSRHSENSIEGLPGKSSKGK